MSSFSFHAVIQLNKSVCFFKLGLCLFLRDQGEALSLVSGKVFRSQGLNSKLSVTFAGRKISPEHGDFS